MTPKYNYAKCACKAFEFERFVQSQHAMEKNIKAKLSIANHVIGEYSIYLAMDL